MFWHVFQYVIKCMFRAKEIIFWGFVFPFALSTFMYLAFGGIFEATEKFHVIPAAVVDQGENPMMDHILSELSKEGENQMLHIQKADEQEAERLLDEEKVEGIIYVAPESHLKVKENGMEETVLQMMLQQIRQNERAIQDVAAEHPEKVQKAVEVIRSGVSYASRKNYGSGNQDNVVNYFYAVFAMTCLYASFASCDRTCKVQADVSFLGQRRNVTPTHKGTIILTEFLACECMQFMFSCLLFLYLKFVLGIEVGDKYGCILLVLLLGTSLGTMLGIFIGSLPRAGEGIKVGILVSITLFLCACSDLMVQGIRDWIERYIPLFNDINPAALICDSFYALNVYETYGRFTGNMMILAGITLALAVVSFFMVRRSRYASL